VVVEAPGVALPIGSEVWAVPEVGFERDGAHAEFLVVPSKGVAPKPASLTMTEAAGEWTAFFTAYLGLVKVAGVREGASRLWSRRRMERSEAPCYNSHDRGVTVHRRGETA
jgi:NADPH:quinone reductase-like Zn-dependent oxidoreductase